MSRDRKNFQTYMSDVVLVAVVNGIVTVATLVISRYMSHLEHKATHTQVTENHAELKEIRRVINGGGDKPDRLPKGEL